MPRYESGKDREQQSMALFQYEKHLQQLGVHPVRCVQTSDEQALSYDAQVWIHGKYVAVAEVKSRRIRSDQYDTIPVEVERLTSLRRQFCRKSSVTGKSYWAKDVIFIFRCVLDDVCYAINIEHIVRLWPTLEDAPADMMKDNHGEQQANKNGKLIPVSQMEKFQ